MPSLSVTMSDGADRDETALTVGESQSTQSVRAEGNGLGQKVVAATKPCHVSPSSVHRGGRPPDISSAPAEEKGVSGLIHGWFSRTNSRPHVGISKTNSAPNAQQASGKKCCSRWSKLRSGVHVANAMSSSYTKRRNRKMSQLDRQDSWLKRFSTRHGGTTVPPGESEEEESEQQARLALEEEHNRFVVNPDENFMFYWLGFITMAVLYNLWTCIAREAFKEIITGYFYVWLGIDVACDFLYICDIFVQLRTGYLERGLIVFDSKKLAKHYVYSRYFVLDLISLAPLDFLQFVIGVHPIIRFPRFFKAYRSYRFVYIVETRTVYPNLWRVVNLSHVLFLGAHWFAAFYFMISQAEGFVGGWGYPPPVGEYASVTRKYLKSLYWSTLTLTTIGDLPQPRTNSDGRQDPTNYWYMFTIVSYLIGVFVFATIVGQVGNVITNRNASRQEFERLLDGAKAYMRNHNVPSEMQRRVQRWYDYAWSRGRMNGGGDINSLGLLPDKLKTELALHVNLETLRKVTIFQECEPEFLHDLVLKMRAFIFTPGDLICRKGEVAREMFIIADGLLEVISDTGEVLTQMSSGDFFGEIGILNLDGGVNRRTADVRSVGYSELFVLSREDVLSALKDHPEAEAILTEHGRKRLGGARLSNRESEMLRATRKIRAKEEANPSPITNLLGVRIASSTFSEYIIALVASNSSGSLCDMRSRALSCLNLCLRSACYHNDTTMQALIRDQGQRRLQDMADRKKKRTSRGSQSTDTQSIIHSNTIDDTAADLSTLLHANGCILTNEVISADYHTPPLYSLGTKPLGRTTSKYKRPAKELEKENLGICSKLIKRFSLSKKSRASPHPEYQPLHRVLTTDEKDSVLFCCKGKKATSPSWSLPVDMTSKYCTESETRFTMLTETNDPSKKGSDLESPSDDNQGICQSEDTVEMDYLGPDSLYKDSNCRDSNKGSSKKTETSHDGIEVKGQSADDKVEVTKQDLESKSHGEDTEEPLPQGVPQIVIWEAPSEPSSPSNSSKDDSFDTSNERHLSMRLSDPAIVCQTLLTADIQLDIDDDSDLDPPADSIEIANSDEEDKADAQAGLPVAIAPRHMCSELDSSDAVCVSRSHCASVEDVARGTGPEAVALHLRSQVMNDSPEVNEVLITIQELLQEKLSQYENQYLDQIKALEDANAQKLQLISKLQKEVASLKQSLGAQASSPDLDCSSTITACTDLDPTSVHVVDT